MPAAPRSVIVYIGDGEADNINILILKLDRVCKEQLLESKQPTVTVQDVLTTTNVQGSPAARLLPP